MLDYVLAALFVVFVWWSSTCAILYLDRRPRHTYPQSFWTTTAIASSALAVLFATRADATPFGAYVAFVCAIVVWGWHEMSFLMGFVTGPRKEQCPAEASGWLRFRYATATLIYHELGLTVTAVAIAAIVWGQPNPIGAWTFAVLWALRLSAKLNIFLGVRNIGAELMPAHLHYLKSYFGRPSFNPLMPISLVLSTGSAILLNLHALSDDATAFQLTGTTLVSTILALGIIEHLILALPMNDSGLWKWAFEAAKEGTTR